MIRLLTNDDESEVKCYLDRNYMETAIISGNLEKSRIYNDRITRYCGDYYGYFDEGRLKGVAAFYNVGIVIPHFESTAAAPGFIEIMRRRKFEVVAGLKRIVEPLHRVLAQHKKVSAYEDSWCLINKGFTPHILKSSITIVEARSFDQSAAVNFIVEAYRQGFNRRFNSELAVKMLADCGPEEDFIFLLDNGIPKAQAIIQVATRRICQIGGVYTTEECRSKGYCKALVSELCRRIYVYGKTPALMVRKDNIPAVKAYQSIGFAYFSDYLVVKFKI